MKKTKGGAPGAIGRWGCLVIATTLSCGLGATTQEVKAPSLQTRRGPEGQPAITPPELTSFTENIADTYVSTVAQALEGMELGAPSARVRNYAQRLKVFVGTTAYSLATSPNPEIAIIDLAVNITIQHSLLQGGLAQRMFGDRGQPLVDAYASAQGQAWSILQRVFTPAQLALLQDGIDRWLQDHRSSQVMLPFVRVPALARYRDISPLTTPGSVRLLAPVAEAARAAMQLRLLGERSIYLAQRYPYLMNWQGEQVLYDTLDTPESQKMIDSAAVFAASAERMANMMEQLPDARLVQGSLAELRSTLELSGPLLKTLRGVMTDLNEAIGGTDRLLAPFQTPAVGGGPADRTFDVGQYTAALREVGATVRELNLLLANSKALVSSPDLTQRLDQMQAVAGTGVGRLGDQVNRWIDRAFWRGAALVGVSFLALLAYQSVTLWLRRRFS